MSYSSLVVSLDGDSGVIAKMLDYDTKDLTTVLPVNVFVIENIFPRETFPFTIIENIVISDNFPNELNAYFPEKVAYVSYHHSTDPTAFEIIVELGRILTALNVENRLFTKGK